MKYLELFESHSNRELIEDCFLEIGDSYHFYLEEYKDGVIKFVGEIIGESLSCFTNGSYIKSRENKLRYDIQKYIRDNWITIEDDTSQGLYPGKESFYYDKGYQVTIDIIKSTESVLDKISKFVIGEDKYIRFDINIYPFLRGTCLVFYIKY